MNKRVLIRFSGDNDFSWLLYEFSTILLRFKDYNRRVKFYGDTPSFTKDEIVNLFNNISDHLYSFYTVDELPPENYLRIREDEIFFNEEVDEKMLSYDSWGNHDSIYIDLENNQFEII